MREVKFALYHDDCHWCTATEKYHGVSVREVSWNAARTGRDHVVCHGLYELHANGRDMLEAVIGELKQDKRLHIELAEIGSNTALVYSRWKSMKSPSDAIRAHSCVPLGSVTIENGVENYRVVTPDENPIGELLDTINGMGNVELKKVGKYTPEKRSPTVLTETQKEALALALEHGYYEWPRNVKLDELAEVKKKSRAAFQKLLRKAEAKIIPQAIKNAVAL